MESSASISGVYTAPEQWGSEEFRVELATMAELCTGPQQESPQDFLDNQKVWAPNPQIPVKPVKGSYFTVPGLQELFWGKWQLQSHGDLSFSRNRCWNPCGCQFYCSHYTSVSSHQTFTLSPYPETLLTSDGKQGKLCKHPVVSVFHAAHWARL